MLRWHQYTSNARYKIVPELQSLLLLFLRFTLIMLFTKSVLSKLVAFHSFTNNLSNFKLVPERFNLIVAYGVIFAEVLIVLSIVRGEHLLEVGFILAQLTIIVFTIVLVLTHIRGIKAVCNCFGPSQQVVGPVSILRNGLIFFLTFVGWSLSQSQLGSNVAHLPTEIVFAALAAVVFSLLLIHVSDISFLLGNLK